MQRRLFLLSGLGALSGAGAWLYFGAGPTEAIAMVLRKRLDYLTLDPDGVRRFAGDLLARNGLSSAKMHLLSALRPLYPRHALSSGNNAAAYMLRHGEDRIVGSFLISSDFFRNGADETRVVRYLGLLDARRACANPFARQSVQTRAPGSLSESGPASQHGPKSPQGA
jgi:hypothetical protein